MATRADSSKKKLKLQTGGWRRLFRLRPRIWAGLFMLMAFGIAGHFLWQPVAPTAARHPQYQITPDAIRITQAPPWIRSDIKSEVLRASGLVGNLSVLDDWDALVSKLREAFEFHPWVASVRQIRRGLPSSLEIDIDYRRPIAAVAAGAADSVTLLPVDVHAVRLPADDLTSFELQYLPRISGVTGRPLVGKIWEEPRVISGARLAAALSADWLKLRLVEIIPSNDPQVRASNSFYTFEILSSGGTRIVWGAAPGEESAAGESLFAAKRKRLLDYAATQGQLDSLDGPAIVDVRGDLVVIPRTAKRGANDTR